MALAAPLLALSPDRAANSYSIGSWSTEQGLASNKIRAVTQTRDGYLWLATAQGITRFDGSRFTNFTGATNPELRGGGFYAVQEAADGSLWVGGDNGLFRFRNGSFDHFTTEQGLPHNYVRALALTRDGALVACTRTGFAVVRNGQISTPPTWKSSDTGVARSFLELADGTVLLGKGYGLWKVSGETVERQFGTTVASGSGFYGLAETPDGSVWIGHNAGLRQVRADGTTVDYGVAEGLADPRIVTLRADRDGNLWIVTSGNGFYRLTKGRIQPVSFPELSGRLNIQQVFEDREGGLWLATSTGLFRMRDNMSSTIGLAEGLAQTSVYSVLESHDGAWWIGLWGGGVYRYDQKKAVKLEVPAALGMDQILSLAEEPDGTLWIGANLGLYRYKEGVTTNLFRRDQATAWQKQLAQQPDAVLPGIAHGHVNSIAPDGDGGLWVATDGALYHGREGAFRVLTEIKGLPGEFFRSVIRVRNGDIWVTVAPAGVACLHEGRWTAYPCGQAISAIAPRAVFEDSVGTIWVTTEGGGLNRFQNGNWRTFTARDGLTDDFISGIAEDKTGNLWIAFPRGVMRVPRTQFAELDARRRTTLQPRVFDKSDGLPQAESNQMGSPNTWLTRDGRLLLATDSGVAVIEPDNLKANALVPPMHLERVLVNGVDTDFSRTLSVAPGGNFVQIHYTAIGLLAPEKVRFKIRLSPLDRDWIDNGTRREVRYDKLPPGDYTFQAIACNNDGVWNTDGVKLAFTVRPFFYQAGWFSGLLTVAVCSTAFGAYRLQVRRARRQMAHLETLVEERTSELRSSKETAEEAARTEHESIAALKRAQEETARERARFQFIFESLPVGIAWMVTGRLQTRIVNPMHAQLSGVPIARRHDLALYRQATHPDDRTVQDGLHYRLVTGEADRYSIEKRYVHADGRICWVAMSARFFRDPASGETQEINTLVDITERKQSEATLANSLSVLQATLESTADGILVVDREGRLVEFNRKFAEMWHLPADILAAGDDERALAFVIAQLKSPEEFTRKVQELYARPEAESFDVLNFTDGRVFERYSQPQRVGGAVVGRVWCFRDVTERKRAEEDLRWKTALLEAQVDSYSVGILVVDTTGKKVVQNRRTIDLWKIPPEIAEGNDDKTQVQFILNRTKNPDRFLEKILYLYAHPNECSVDEIELLDGTILDRYSAPVMGRDGKLYGRIWTFIDITERKRAEAALQVANRELVGISRQAGMAEVATGVLHNVGNVLNSVNVSASLLSDRLRLSKIDRIAKLGGLLREHEADLGAFFNRDPRGREVPAYLDNLAAHLADEQRGMLEELDSLRKNIEHINDIVAMQQSYAKVSGVVETVSAIDLVEDAVRMNASALARHDVTLVRDFQARPVITVEKHKVLQILVNLMRNAKYACDESGRKDRQMTVRVAAEAGRVRITVVDNGVGIPAENLVRIFSHGFTTRANGHGFGLHNGALAARDLGGSLTVQSAGPGQGATFVLELPVQSATITP